MRRKTGEEAEEEEEEEEENKLWDLINMQNVK